MRRRRFAQLVRRATYVSLEAKCGAARPYKRTARLTITDRGRVSTPRKVTAASTPDFFMFPGARTRSFLGPWLPGAAGEIFPPLGKTGSCFGGFFSPPDISPISSRRCRWPAILSRRPGTLCFRRTLQARLFNGQTGPFLGDPELAMPRVVQATVPPPAPINTLNFFRSIFARTGRGAAWV